MVKKTVSQNKILFKDAQRYLVGGVNSPVRAFNYVGGEPLLFKKGRAAKIYDYDGKSYIDYVLSWGSLILGHSHPQVVREVGKKVRQGLSFGATNETEILLAKAIQGVIPQAQKIRFVNSGTEAVMSAIRLARGYTERNKIIKFQHAYHGHADYLLASAGSGLATLAISQSKGVPRDFIKETIVLPWTDALALKKTFVKYGKQIAAILFEPAGGNYGVIPPDAGFLKYAVSLSRRYGSLVVADEVITGFRFRFGALCHELGVDFDLICLGKIIGGGLPIGAYAGKDEIMRHLAPLGKVYQASTFAGNPVVMSAGLTTLKVLSALRDGYAQLEALTEYLAGSLEDKAGPDLKISRFGPMFSLRFKQKERFVKFYQRMLQRGIFFAPSEFEANFLSFAHTKNDIEKTIEVAKDGKY